MTDILVDQAALRAQVQQKYREVALEPGASFHFHTGRSLGARLGCPAAAVDRLPDTAVESFAGVGSPFALRDLESGERVVDVGCGAGFDTILAADQVGPDGRVIGVDMTRRRHRQRQPGTDTGLRDIDLWTG
jgi:arsenite methyltransferase